MKKLKIRTGELGAYVEELRLKIMYNNVVTKANPQKCSTWAERTLRKRRNPR